MSPGPSQLVPWPDYARPMTNIWKNRILALEEIDYQAIQRQSNLRCAGANPKIMLV